MSVGAVAGLASAERTSTPPSAAGARRAAARRARQGAVEAAGSAEASA